jgi:transcriptional regulator with XRE-family HTH domain
MTSQIKETFGEFIRRHRLSHGLNLTQLAAQLNLDSANLSKIENGKREFDPKKIDTLSTVLDLNPEVVKQEYFSDIIAKKLYKNDCTSKVLVLAEEKLNYYKTINK